VQALAVRTGLKKPPADLQRLEQTHAESIRFLEGSQRRLAELERAWLTKRLAYDRKLKLEGEEIVKAKRYLGVIDRYPDQTRSHQHPGRGLDRHSRDRDRGGWSR
jgi:hypothetical protein